MTRDERFGLVLTGEEKNMLKQLAYSEGGLSAAAMLRRLIRSAAREKEMRPVRPTVSIEDDAANE
jgi:hypothetical protein